MVSKKINKNKYNWFFVLLFPSVIFSQKWYLNDESQSGDVFTTALGTKYNSGKTSDAPSNSLTYIFQNARKGDTVFIDRGRYAEINTEGVILIPKPEGITVVFYTDIKQPKNELPANVKATAEEFYILNDKPVSREDYIKAKSKL